MYLVNYIKRGRGDTIYFPLIVAGANDLAVAADYTYAAGDFKISIDGAANANPTNAPTYDTDARAWALTLEDAETAGRCIIITAIDSATKAVEDQTIIITTDVSNGIVSSDIATLASQTSFTLANGSPDNDAYNGYAAMITDASNRDQRCLGLVSDYVGSTRTVTLSEDPGIFTMAAGDYVELVPAFTDRGLSAQAKLDVNAEVDTAISDASLATAASITALNDLSAADVNAEVDTAISDAALATAANLAAVDTVVDAVLVDTNTTIPGLIAALNNLSVSDILTGQITESYAADGAAPTLAQALMAIQQRLLDADVSGTTLTVRQLDGTTAAMTLTLDDGTTPTDVNRTA